MIPLPKELEEAVAEFCRHLDFMTMQTNALFDGYFDCYEDYDGPEPDGYRYLGGGLYGSSSR